MARITRITSMLTLLLCLFSFRNAAAGGGEGMSASEGASGSQQAELYLEKARGYLYKAPQKALDNAKMAVRAATPSGDEGLLAESLMLRGTAHWAMGEYAPAMDDYREARLRFRDQGDSLGVARADNNLGLVFMEQGYFDLALESLMRALRFFEARNDSARLAIIYTNVGSVYKQSRMPEAAENFLRKALDLASATGDTLGMARNLNNLGLMVEEQGRREEAIRMYRKSLDYYAGMGDRSESGQVMNNLGNALKDSGKYTEAEKTLLEALNIALENGHGKDIMVSRMNLAGLFLETGDGENAKTQAEGAVAVGEGSGALYARAAAEEVLARVYEHLGEYEGAIHHYRQHKILSDSVYNKRSAEKTAELRIQYESRLKDLEIESLTQTAEKGKWRNLALSGIALFILCLALAVWVYKNGQVKRERIEREKDREAHRYMQSLREAEIRNKELEGRRLQDAVDYKAREITNLSLNILRRNELLDELESMLDSARNAENPSLAIAEVMRRIRTTLHNEVEREQLGQVIQQAQQDFFHSLEQKFPELSKRDRKLCGMIRQGLSSKEIAAVFGISAKSVDISRYRLRKKLGLDKGDNLNAFLESV